VRAVSAASARNSASAWGGCDKDRTDRDVNGQPDLNHFCAGYLAFFEQARPVLETM
jgi:sulfatase maturation enzyme AslB (radical SAM superfamily)